MLYLNLFREDESQTKDVVFKINSSVDIFKLFRRRGLISYQAIVMNPQFYLA